MTFRVSFGPTTQLLHVGKHKIYQPRLYVAVVLISDLYAMPESKSHKILGKACRFLGTRAAGIPELILDIGTYDLTVTAI
jgi:hypothetical protein